jgi:hypothetical protein
MKIQLLALFMLFSLAGFAQVTETFDDGDISSNPVWTGDVGKFAVTSGQLNSASTDVNDQYYISTASSTIEEWEFTVDMQFSTSSANYTDVYLMSDVQDLNSPNNGYFVRIGNTDDEVSLYSVSSGSQAELIDGTDDMTHNTLIVVRVTRDGSGNWNLFADYGSGPVLEGSVIDNTHSSSSYFGLKIKQSTASFHTKHFYDNIYVGSLRVDTISPEVTSISFPSNTEIELEFSEGIVNATTSSFVMDATYGSPSSIDVNGTSITLSYPLALVNGGYNLTLTNLQDASGNALDTIIPFNYFEYLKPQPGDIIINEVYADPTPSYGLPDAEFVEIYNKTFEPINLENCTITDGSKTANFKEVVIPSNSYAIVCDESDAALFASYGVVIGVIDFPTLNNSGDALILTNESGDTIDQLNYTDDFYKDEFKKGGGYTLERIEFNTICAESSNWIASNDLIGGTPGKVNSVFGIVTDSNPPRLENYLIENNNSIRLVYSEDVVQGTSMQVTNFEIQESGENPSTVEFFNGSSEVLITFGFEFDKNTLFHLIVQGFRDCFGNYGNTDTVELARVEMPKFGEIIINELLFNPKTDGVDFIELYNNSNSFIDLTDLQVARVFNNEVRDIKPTSQVSRLLKPKEYVAITTDTLIISQHYRSGDMNEVGSLPPMNNDEGIVVLLNSNLQVIDSVPYHEDQHFELLSTIDGVSLERLSYAGSSTNPSNWFSASASEGFATPGYKNSQAIGSNAPTSTFAIESKTVSPDGDGYEDLLVIHYNTENPGFVASAFVYDLSGRLVAQPSNNVSLSTEGILTWDGLNNNGEKVPVGNYILLLKAFDLDGKTVKNKFAFSIVSAF